MRLPWTRGQGRQSSEGRSVAASSALTPSPGQARTIAPHAPPHERVRELVQYTDWFVVMSATSDRHAAALRQHIERSLRTDAAEVAAAWDGAVLRVVQKATLSELVEKRGVAQLVGMPVPTVRTQRIIRAHLTGFLLFHLTGNKTYREFAAADAAFPRTTPPDPAATPPTDEERIIALFK